MGVRKFRGIEEMERERWRQPGDPALYQVIARLWDFGRRTGGRRFPPGVYRHRSIADLNAQTERWRSKGSSTGTPHPSGDVGQ